MLVKDFDSLTEHELRAAYERLRDASDEGNTLAQSILKQAGCAERLSPRYVVTPALLEPGQEHLYFNGSTYVVRRALGPHIGLLIIHTIDPNVPEGKPL